MANQPVADARVGDMRSLAEYGAEQSKPEIVSLSRGNGTAANILVLPDGKHIHSIKQYLDEYLPAPERRHGTANLTTVESLVAHANRFKDEHSVVFATESRKNPSITVVLDYHEQSAAGKPRWGKHRAHYAFPFSDEWTAWQAKNGVVLDQKEFAEFMEDRIADVLQPPPGLDGLDGKDVSDKDTGGDFGARSPDEQLTYLAKLLNGRFAGPSRIMELSRGLAVHANEKVQQAVTLDSGEMAVQYVSDHVNAAGDKVKVPNLFLIGIPVFRLGVRYRIAARLRYRLVAGSIKWFYELYRHDAVFDDAFRESCAKVTADTALPLLYGTPE